MVDSKFDLHDTLRHGVRSLRRILVLSKRTCLLLGAGASAHLGFPLGGELRQRMLSKLRGLVDTPRNALPDDFRRGGEDLAAFYNRFAYGYWNSPDAFLERYPEFTKTGKYLICNCLSEFETPASVTERGGWYDRLISVIHVDTPAKLRNSNLSIVTFNYDRSIDFRLHKYVEHHFGIKTDEAWQLVKESMPIVHVHGTLGEYPTWSYGDRTSEWERGQDIKIVSEVAENTEEFRHASELLNNAERVVVLGFGFGADNVRRLRFFRQHQVETRDIVIATGAGGRQVDDWLAQWGLIKDRHHFSATAESFWEHSANPLTSER